MINIYYILEVLLKIKTVMNIRDVLEVLLKCEQIIKTRRPLLDDSQGFFPTRHDLIS